MAKDRDWTGKTGGTKWMQQSLISMFSHFDPRWVSPIVAFWILGYIIAQPQGTKGIYHYWRKRMGKKPIAACLHLYATYFQFGMVVMDRFAAYAGRRFDIQTNGHDILDNIKSSDNGAIIFSSHVGNQELAGYSFHTSKPMHVLLFLGDTPTVNENRERMFNQMGLYFLPMQPDGSHVFAMHEVLMKGDLLSIHGDRMFYGQRALKANILGEDADFPEGPFRVAAAENVPVITLFMMKEKGRKYTLYVRKLSDGCREGMTKKDYSQFLLNAYVQQIEQMMTLYPHQWFHFYRFWK